MHALIASRVLLHMRSQAKRPTHEPQWSALANTTRSTPGTNIVSKNSFADATDSGYVMHLQQLSYTGVDVERRV